jgi:pyruvate ferredoxin oxidoreductase alpha subunit
MNRKLLTGNAAAAWGARLARVDYMPAFPITPQTEIVETLAAWCADGTLDGRLTVLESEHSMLTAAAAAAATGVRVFSATSSQGLLYGMEMIFGTPGWRAPFVLVNVSRGLQSPVTLEPDHNDVLAARDSGCLQFHCASCQEVVDAVLLAYRIAEDHRVRLPAIVNLDGFYLSFTREPVTLPTLEQADAFLPRYDAETTRFDAVAPVSQACAVLGGGPYSYFRYETHLAALAALEVFDAAADEFTAHCGRHYSAVEAYCMEDAEFAVCMIGSFATKAQEAVDRLREAGRRVGLVRPLLVRPFPAEALARLLCGRRAVAVIDQNLSFGKGGILAAEVASALYGRTGAPPLASYVGGLGGRDIRAEEFYAIADELEQAAASGATPPPRLLYSADELREMRKLQAIAHAQHREVQP